MNISDCQDRSLAHWLGVGDGPYRGEWAGMEYLMVKVPACEAFEAVLTSRAPLPPGPSLSLAALSSLDMSCLLHVPTGEVYDADHMFQNITGIDAPSTRTATVRRELSSAACAEITSRERGAFESHLSATQVGQVVISHAETAARIADMRGTAPDEFVEAQMAHHRAIAPLTDGEVLRYIDEGPSCVPSIASALSARVDLVPQLASEAAVEAVYRAAIAKAPSLRDPEVSAARDIHRAVSAEIARDGGCGPNGTVTLSVLPHAASEPIVLKAPAAEVVRAMERVTPGDMTNVDGSVVFPSQVGRVAFRRRVVYSPTAPCPGAPGTTDIKRALSGRSSSHSSPIAARGGKQGR